jgi:photosystem II stability/assembly factor-like uncharacterized protein
MNRRGLAVAGMVLALAAAGANARTANAAGLSSLLSGQFQSIPAAMLPSGGVIYDDATCPSESRCYVVGSGPGDGVITTTDDGGRTWTTSKLPATGQFTEFALSCPSASVCYVGGNNVTPNMHGPIVSAILVTRDAGASWRTDTVPAGVVVASIGCGSPTRCVAVGSDIPTLSTSTVINTVNGGSTWRRQASPADGLTSVRCRSIAYCWAAGPGALFTTNLGATWRSMSPAAATNCPTTGFGFCDSVYSETIDIEFQSSTDGWVVGGTGCGGVTVTECSGVAIHTIDGGVTWAVSTGSTKYGFGWQIACQGSACLFVTQGFGFSNIVTTADAGAEWTQMQTVGTTLSALACTPSHSMCLVAGGLNGEPVVMTLGLGSPLPPIPAVKSLLSTVGGSLASPAALLAAPLTALVNALITVGLILLATFPSVLFNRTYDENHERIRRWWERRLSFLTRLRSVGSQLRGSVRAALSATAVVLVGGVLAALLDPGFGLNVRTVALFIGAVLALVFGAAVTAITAGLYRISRHRVGVWHVRALPSALLVAAACVLVSRITDFQPGYLYGLIGGVVFTGPLTRRQEGHEVAIASLTTLCVSVAAWLVWVPVSTAASADPASFDLALLENFFAALFLSGMVGLLIGLIPLRFLPGERVAQWHWGAWVALFGVAMLTVMEVVIRPQTSAARGVSAPFWTTLGLFIGFGVASILFWAYFKRSEQPEGAVAPD